MRAAVGGTRVVLKVSRELSGLVTHLGGKPSSRPHGWSAILRPDRAITGFLRTLWNDFVDSIWRCRNEIAHKKDNLTQQVNEETWASRLMWFLEHKHTITRADQFLLTFTAEDIQRMSGSYRRRLVQNLETVLEATRIERTQKERGQHVITRYFSRVQ